MEQKKQTILVFCAHSDDQIFGPGATIIKYAQKGDDIYTYVFSYGESGIPLFKPEEAVKVRVNEAKAADRFIGGKGVVFFGLKEGKFAEEAYSKGIQELIVKIIEQKKPDKIFTHSPDDPHPDHRSTYKVVVDAIDRLHYNVEVYVFDVWNPFTITKRNLPKLYEDVSKTLHLKVKALEKFKSQKFAFFTLLWGVYAKAFIHGMHIHKLFAERFVKVR
jgi:LmbE family N-acetylglucosaminyl deacetylase